MLRSEIENASPHDRWALMKQYVRHQTAQVLGVDDEEVDCAARYPELGLTSLSFIELAQRMRRAAGYELAEPPDALSVDKLADRALENLVGPQGYVRPEALE